MDRAFTGKLLGDLKAMLGRLIVLGLAIGAGVLVLTAITGAASSFLREMSKSYEDTFPASATIELAKPVDEGVARRLIGPGAIAVRTGGNAVVRFQDGKGLWQPMVLFIEPELKDAPIARVFPEPGEVWPPMAGAPAVERTAMTTFDLKKGEGLRIRLSAGQTVQTMPFSVVHDPAVAPAYQERTAYAYIDGETARLWGLETYSQVKVRFDQDLDWAGTKKKATEVATSLQNQGFEVTAIAVPPVHAHPHQGILTTLLTILGAFGVLTIILCSFLVSNVIEALIARERRWIGVMKTLGASRSRVLVLFLSPVVFLGLVAVSWSVPLGILASGGLTQAIGSLLNIRVVDLSVGWWAWALPAACGLVLPMLLALVPVGRAMRMTILESITDVDTDRRTYSGSPGPVSRFLSRVSPLLGMAWRNSLRKKRRLAISLLLLGVGGGLFMTAFNVSTSWKGLVMDSLQSRKMSYQIRLVGDRNNLDLESVLPEGTRIETWASLPAVTNEGKIPVEATYPDESHGSFRLFSLPPQTEMVNFRVQRGRWLEKKGEVVLNQTAAVRYPGAEPGSRIRIVAGGEERFYTLAGVVQEVGQAAAYLCEGELDVLKGDCDYRTELLVRVPRDAAAEKKVVESWLENSALPVEVFLDNSEYAMAGTEHFALLIMIFLITGLITGLVGWLGIASVLSLAVVERRREFGILRSVGATPGDLRSGILAEALVMTALGSLTASALAYPISYGLGAFLGNLSLKMTIPVRLDLTMALGWFALSLIAGVVASLGAGAKASKTTIRETLTLT